MIKKKGEIANFNIVFGEDEKPLLEYFNSIVYPALTSGITKKSEGIEYIIKNAEVIEVMKDEFALVGKIVKKTMLEVLSDLDEDGELIEKDEKYTTAPYSTFSIFLKNHRMLLVPNQKGSPTLINFRTTIAYVISQYVANINKELKTEEKLPIPIINIIGIPSSRSINEVLKNVSKVNLLTLRFYPLNGDIDFAGMFETMTTDLRKKVGSKSGETVLKSPKSVEGIIEVLEQAGGTINPILKVTTKDKSTMTLKDYQISEKYEIDFDEFDTFEEETRQIVSQGKNLEVLQYMNDEHNRIYKEYVGNVIPFIKKK